MLNSETSKIRFYFIRRLSNITPKITLRNTIYEYLHSDIEL